MDDHAQVRSTSAEPERSLIEVSGRVVGSTIVAGSGNTILNLSVAPGGSARIDRAPAAPKVDRRPPPVFSPPRDFPDLLGRAAELTAAVSAIDGNGPIEIVGEAGIGKTALLRHLAHRIPHARTHNLVHDGTGTSGADDTLQMLFQAFYDCDPPYRPTGAERRRLLADIEAVVLLDNRELTRSEIEELGNSALGCVFVITGEEQQVFGEGIVVSLRGLSAEASLDLIARQLGRSLTESERIACIELSRVLKGHPLRIAQAASRVREGGDESQSVLGGISRWRATGTLVAADIAGSLSAAELAVLGLLDAVAPAPLSPTTIGAIVGVSEAALTECLASLERRALVQTSSPRYRLSGTLDEAVHEQLIQTDWNSRLLTYYASLAGDHGIGTPPALEEQDALLHALDHGVEHGEWSAVIDVATALEPALVTDGRWQAWNTTLDHRRVAARKSGNQRAESLAIHQAGTRAACMGELAVGTAQLREALELRRAADDPELSVTEHNLAVLEPPPPPPPGKGDGIPWPPRGPLLVALAGAALAVAAAVAIAIWTGGTTLRVPDVVGDHVKLAERTIRGAHLQPKVELVRSATVPRNVVEGSTPAPGSKTAKGATVTLAVSTGITTVPNVVGDGIARARQRLSAAHLRVGRITRKASSHPVGQVLSQHPAAATKVSFESSVSLELARAAPPIKVKVPDVRGDSIDAARAALQAVGLKVGSTTPQPSSLPTGTVISQTPAANTAVPPNSSVGLTLASTRTTPSVSVPDLQGDTLDAATAALQAVGLKVGSTTPQPSSLPTGTVISQTPAAHTTAQPGSSVNVTLATPISTTVSVPDLQGDTLDAATAALQAVGLKVGSTTPQPSSLPTGTVISQTPAAHTTAQPGSSVNVTLATTPPPPTVPNVIGNTTADAERALSALGFKYKLSYATGNAGFVIAQTPTGGTPEPSGYTVSLTIGEVG
jgi:beta-lactam-binding protein with PASTA domain